jgi:hypothetical protein
MKLNLLLTLPAVLFTGACGTKPNTGDTGAGPLLDRDLDGYANDVDCDDTNPDVYPDAPEICDQLDNDCDSEIDEDGFLSYVDADQDGFGDPATEETTCEEDMARVTNGGDCDDTNPAVNPDAVEVCDGLDNDCDSQVDAEGLASFTDANGAVADYSALLRGIEGAPASISMSDGTLSVCEGTYFVNIEATGPLSIVGYPDESGAVVLDAGGVNNVLASAESAVDLAVENVTMTGGVGWIDSFGTRVGGAMSVDTNGGSGSVVLSNVVVSGNSAETGGGLYIWGADATLTDVEIVGNTATSWTGGAVLTDGAVSMTRVDVSGNFGGYTGGLSVFGSTVSNVAQFEDVTVQNNSSDWGASALYLSGNILEWTASSPGASAVLNNTDQEPGTYLLGAIELTMAEISVTNVDFGEEDSSDNNALNDIRNDSGAYNAGSGASFMCDGNACGTIQSLSMGGGSEFTPFNPSMAVGQVFEIDSGRAATLENFTFDYFFGKECGSGTMSLVEGSNPQNGKSSNWTVLDSRYAEVSQGTVGADFGYPLRSGGIYAVVFTPNCSFTNSTASLGSEGSEGLVQLGFGQVIGLVSGSTGSSTMSLVYTEGSQSGQAVYESTIKTVQLD